MEWINCKDGMPDKYQDCLVTDGEDYWIAYWRDDIQEWDNTIYGFISKFSSEYIKPDIVCWCPISKPTLILNNLNTNANLVFNCDEEALKKFNFKKISKTDDIPEHWSYSAKIDTFNNMFFELNYYLEKYKDANLEIFVYEVDKSNRYDYWMELKSNPTNIFAKVIQSECENIIHKLQSAGILSGHKFGERL